MLRCVLLDVEFLFELDMLTCGEFLVGIRWFFNIFV